MISVDVNKVAERLGKCPQVVRIMLQKGMLPFGFAFKMPGSKMYTYVIYPEKFKEYCGPIDDEIAEMELEAVMEQGSDQCEAAGCRQVLY